MKLSDNLKKIRKENNLSQEQLAEKLKVSRQSVSKWESGQAYPEMDKVLQICKIFNYNIDELMNENIKDVDESKQSKINFNRYVDDFFSFITKTVNMFSCMKLKEILKCLIEQFIICIILACIFGIIGVIGSTIVGGILGGLPHKVYYTIYGLFSSIYLILAAIIGITVFLHIFKIRYLDYYEIVKEESETEKIISDENIDTNKKKNTVIEKNKDKIIIRDPEHSQSKFLTGILKTVFLFIKVTVTCILAVFSLTFVAEVVLLVVSFLFVKTGLVFIGAFLGITSAILINLTIMEILYNFIVSKDNKIRKVAICLLIALILAGVGIGLIFIGITEFNYIENQTDVLTNEEVYEYDMLDEIVINYSNYDINYIESDSDKIKIVINYTEYYDIDIYKIIDDTLIISCYQNESKRMDNLRAALNDINNKELRNYSYISVTIYASNDTIEKLK